MVQFGIEDNFQRILNVVQLVEEFAVPFPKLSTVRISRLLFICTLGGSFLLASMPSAESQQKKSGALPKGYKVEKWKPGTYAELHRPVSMQELSSAPTTLPIPSYSTATFVSGQTFVDAFGKHTVLRLLSGDNYTSVAAWYKAALKNGGWEMKESAPLPGTTTQTMTGFKMGKFCRVQISKKENGTDIYLSIKEK